jgi:DNA mismatch repair protein MutL
MGFRGEAMASIAAIAQVELKTHRIEDELGTVIQIEGSKVVDQSPEALPHGTSISVKNLFYNVPARRNFLKSNPVETRHIIDEFQRIALAHPDKFFSLHNDGNEVFHLPPGTLKQRVIHLFGNNYNQRLVPVEEETTIISISGFIGKPEFAKKTRGEQFFFVNKRFVKDPYLNHAVMGAYEDILPTDSYPFYVLFIDIDPAKIDINVHPTKTEIKYEDEKAIYAILKSAVKRSIGRYNIAPSLDFDQETSFSNFITQKPLGEIQAPTISFNPNFNPFDDNESGSKNNGSSRTSDYASSFERKTAIPQNWDTLYQVTEQEQPRQIPLLPDENEGDTISFHGEDKKQFFQIHNRYIVSQIHSGFILIDQQAAHERILFEQYLEQLEQHKGSSQQSLFPVTIELQSADFALMTELLPDLQTLGFQLRPFGKTTYIIDGIPADLGNNVNEAIVIEKLLEDIKNNKSDLQLDKRENLAKSLARSAALKAGTALSNAEMSELIDKLFACQSPNISVNGKPTIVTFSLQDLMEKFDKI